MTIILPNIKGLTIVKYLVSLFLICGFQLLQSQPLAFDHTPTAQSGVLIGEVKLDGGIVPEGSWIAAFDSQGNCAGASEVVTFDGATYANLTIFGDDPATTMIDEGLTPNDYFILQLYDLESEQIFVYLENGELSSLFGWTNNNGAPMPGYNDPERVFEFQTSATIFQSVNETVMQPTCFGALDGKVELFVEGLFPPFSFGWNTGADGEALSNLDTGQFFCTITDNWGNNLMVGPFLINAPEPLIIEMNDGLDTCNSDKGLLTPLVYGGTPPFTYVWSTGATTPEIFNLPAGIYQVTVEDANGCDLTAVAGVEPVPEPGISFEINEAKCFGGNDGSISGAITGGITPFSWLWSNGETSNTIVDLIAGIYSVTIQDGLGCVQQELVVVGQPDSISVTFQVTPSSTAEGGYYNGNVFAEVTRGTPPYSYEWDDPNMQLLPTLEEVASGDYTLTVTDDSGCIYTGIVNVPLYVGTSSRTKAELKGVVFPNPSQSGMSLFLDFKEKLSNFAKISIYSSEGRKIGDFSVNENHQVYEVEVGQLPSGTYLIYIPGLNIVMPEFWIVQE